MYKLNSRITVKRFTTTKNEFGGLVADNTSSWTKWAEVRDRYGSPRSEYQQRQWTYDQIFVMRYETERPTQSNDVISYNGIDYKINSLQIRSEAAKDWEFITATKLDESIN